MNISEENDFVLTTSILYELFLEMEANKFIQTLNDALLMKEVFIAMDDCKTFASLSESENIIYASCVRLFLGAVENLERVNKLYQNQRYVALALAKTIALWQTVRNFQTLHGTLPEKIE
ncbi:hypothetical protein EXS45_01770 [Candidatus Nomurabacteria bacterium]|nr:hypothetical protein [Candidatus Nomurabacteria bacterium]